MRSARGRRCRGAGRARRLRRRRRRHRRCGCRLPLAEERVRGLRRVASTAREASFSFAGLRRARRPDPQGRAAGRVRGRQHEAAGRAARRRAWSSGRSTFATNRLVVAVPADGSRWRVARRPRGAGRADRGRARRRCRSAPTRARSRAPGAASGAADRAQHPLERARRRGRDRQGGAGRGGRRLRLRDRRARRGWAPARRSRSRPGCSRRSSTERPSSKGADAHRGGARVRRGPARAATARARCARAGFEPPPATVTAVARAAWTALLVGATAITLCFLTLPVAAIFVDVGPGELLRSLDDPVAVDALVLSLEATAIALVVIVVGRARRRPTCSRRARSGDAPLALTLIELPLILPPAAAGIGLLAALGPQGIIGPALDDLGIELPLTTAGVVVALVFVSSPFYVRQAQAAFARPRPDLIDASRTLGASEARTFARVAIPLALPSLGDRRGARLGPGAGRVRRDADVRGELPRRDADRAARDLRALRHATSTPRWRCRRCSSRSAPRCCSRSSCLPAREARPHALA